MNLTKALRHLILDRFLVGATLAECAMWYGLKEKQAEAVIRKRLKEYAEQEKANGLANPPEPNRGIPGVPHGLSGNLIT